jgi:mannose-6-phosphate isomerase class I
MVDILHDNNNLFKVHLSVIPPKETEFYKFPRYISILEGNANINLNCSRINLKKGSIFLCKNNTIENNCDRTYCIILSHINMTKFQDMSLL